MNLKELIENNIDQFIVNINFKEIIENEFIIDFNNKLKVEFKLNEKHEKLFIAIIEQNKKYWNKEFGSYDNEFNFETFNGWTIRTNNATMLDFCNKMIDLKGYNEDDNKDGSYYNNQQQIIDLILALEDWSINCPFFKKETKKEEIKLNNNDSKYPIIDHSLNNKTGKIEHNNVCTHSIQIYNGLNYINNIRNHLQKLENIIKEKDDKIQELENKLLETNKTVDEIKNRLKDSIIELIEGV